MVPVQQPVVAPRSDVADQDRFYGHAEWLEGVRKLWRGGREVLAMAYDVMISGYATKSTNNLDRLCT